MNNGHNPGVIPGYYNPSQQTKTEAFDYQAFVDTEFIDPTTIPMHPRDTVVPMQPPERSPVQPMPHLIQPNEQRSPQGLQASPYTPQPAPQTETQDLYQKRMELEYQRRGDRSVEAIKIPIVIELTINLNINRSGG